MKAFKNLVVSVFIVSVLAGVGPDLIHPYSHASAIFDFGVVFALIGPSVWAFWERRVAQLTLGAVSILAALVWTLIFLIPHDHDRDWQDLASWVYFEVLLLVIVGVTIGRACWSYARNV